MSELIDALKSEMDGAWDDQLIDLCHTVTSGNPDDPKPDILTAMRWRLRHLMNENEGLNRLLDKRACSIVALQEEVDGL